MVDKELIQRAINLSSLLKKELTPLIPERAWGAERARLSYSEKERLLRVRHKINDRLVEILFKRALQDSTLETEPIVVNTYPEKKDSYTLNAFCEDIPSVFYVLNDTFYSSENEFMGNQESFEETDALLLSLIAGMEDYFGYDFESIEESDIDDYLDYMGEVSYCENDEVYSDSFRAKAWNTIMAVKAYRNTLGKKNKKLTSRQKEICEDVYSTVIDTLSKMCRDFETSEISNIGDFISLEDVVINFPQLVGNLYSDGYDRELYVYLSKDIPKVYLHQDDYKDTPEKKALICAIDYFKDLERKLPFFPGTQVISFMKEDAFVLFTGVGGLSGEEYLVDYDDYPNWWNISKQLIDILLPVVLNQKN